MAYSINKFIKLKTKFLLDTENDDAQSELWNYMFNHEKEVVLPLLGNAFIQKQFSKDEIKAIVGAVLTCLCETHFKYVSFALNHLSVSYSDDKGGEYDVSFDGVKSDGEYVGEHQLGALIDEDGNCRVACW